MPMRYLEWLLEELPNTPGADDPAALGRFTPWTGTAGATHRSDGGGEGIMPGIRASKLINVGKVDRRYESQSMPSTNSATS